MLLQEKSLRLKLGSGILLAALFINLMLVKVYAQASIKSTEVSKSIYMLEGVNGFIGGNVAVSVGDDGVLLVDSLVSGRDKQLLKTIKDIGGGKTRYLLNTHWHGDHTGGNGALSQQAVIVAHDNVRHYLQNDQKNFFGESKAKSSDAWPVLTFDSTMTVHFNNETIKLMHYPNGHTNGDAVVYFKQAGVLHMGDTYFKDTFPFVDLSTGGNVVGLAANIGKIIDKMPKDTKIIPGHGPLASIDELKRYHQMLLDSVKVVKKAMKAGKSIEQLQKQGLGAQFEPWSKGFIKEKDWIVFVYQSIEKNQGKKTAHQHGHSGVHHH